MRAVSAGRRLAIVAALALLAASCNEPTQSAASARATQVPLVRAPAPKPALGGFTLASVPTGAKVSVDGEEVGLTPIWLADLSPGSRRIHLEAEGYRPWETSLEVSADVVYEMRAAQLTPLIDPASPFAGPTVLLVAAPSRGCTLKRCDGRCCNTCGFVAWRLASDPAARVDAHRVKLPKVVATECGLHYDLRAAGEQKGDRFVVRAVEPVPSERGRHPGMSGRLELRTRGGDCTMIGCSPSDPCCNTCSFSGWRPKPTGDVITWSGQPLPNPDRRMCGKGFDLAVTGAWLGPSAFEVKSVRKLRP